MPFYRPQVPSSLRTTDLTPNPEYIAYIEDSPALLWLSDVHGDLLHANNTWRLSTGANIADYRRESVWDLVHADDRDRLARLTQNLGLDSISYEFRQLQSDGSYHWMLERVRPWLSQDGLLAGYISNATDIQAQKQREANLTILSLRQNSLIQFSRRVMENDDLPELHAEVLSLVCEHLSVPAAVLILQQIENGPLSILATHGLDPASPPPQLSGSPLRDNTAEWPADEDSFPLSAAWLQSENWTEAVTVSLDPRQPSLGCIVALRRGALQASIGPLHYARDLASILQVAHTRIRSQTKSQETAARTMQAQKMEAVGLLAGGLAHDFNNLLTAIRCFADLLLDDLSDPAQRAKVEDILHASSRASHLVRQLVSFSRQEAAHPEPTDLNTIIDSLRGFLRSVLSEHVQIQIDLSENAAWCHVDGKQLEQIIFNLCLNARDVMPADGRLTLSVSHRPETAEGKRFVRLAVADTGPGIPEAVQEKLFQPFYSTKPKGRGTGLGLASSLEIARSFGGTITYETAPGKGTVFYVDLPEIADPLADEMGAEHGPDALSGHPCGGVRVLLVEDDELVRAVSCLLAESLGHSVIAFGDSLEASAWAEETRLEAIDLLITDIIMPSLNGYELSKRLYAIKPELKVLFMSGYVEDDTTVKAMARPGVVFLPKPFTGQTFAAKLAETLAHQA